jgi:hypothetical protein
LRSNQTNSQIIPAQKIGIISQGEMPKTSASPIFPKFFHAKIVDLKKG